jgi:hypothetical protein
MANIALNAELVILVVGFFLTVVLGIVYEMRLHYVSSGMIKNKSLSEFTSRFKKTVIVTHFFSVTYFFVRLIQVLIEDMPSYLMVDLAVVLLFVTLVFLGRKNLESIKSMGELNGD